MSEIPYNDLPIEVRRANWGWFGPAWWSFVCYDESGRLIEEMRKPFPAGEKCMYCGEVFDEAVGDNGQAVPLLSALTNPVIRHAHKECTMRQVAGPLAHLHGRCSCQGGTDHDAPGMTQRQEALAVWAWVQQHGTEPIPR